ncbi:MAG: tetratricopeptide repeat protein [Planctomycetota bacterium]
MRLSAMAVILVLLAAPALADEGPVPTGAAHAARGEKLVAKGDIEGALKAYLEARKAAPKNEAYARRAMILKRVTRLRRLMATDESPERWGTVAVTLHAFYLDEGLAKEALEIDRKAHARVNTSGSAIRLAETLLALDRSEEAARLLAARRGATFHERALQGIALARLGRRKEATAVGAAISLPKEDVSPAQLRDVARLKVRLGTNDEAFALLRRSLEQTPEAGLETARKRIRACADFAGISSLPAFRKVLETASKVHDTCSGGDSCGSCPSRDGCGKR